MSDPGPEVTSSRVKQALGGKPVVKIFLLNNSSKTLIIDPATTAKDVCETMAGKLGLENPKEMASFFGLYEAKNGSHVDRALGNDESVVSVISAWPEGAPSLLVFQIKLFMETLTKSEDPHVMELRYVQAVHHVITGLYPVDEATSVLLAGMQLYARVGAHDPEVHKTGFLADRIREFIPAPLQRKSKKLPSQWEADIYVEQAKIPTDGYDVHKAYVAAVETLDVYGDAFFIAKQKHFPKLPKTVLLGISCKGIHILKPGRGTVFMQFKLSEIYRWGFKPDSNFYFEVKKVGGSGPVYEFETGEGNLISDLLTDYAMALLKELGISPDETAGDGAKGMDESQAATRIQASFRGYKLRHDLECEYAAIRVQAVYRGFKERKRFDAMIADMERELEGAAE